MTALEFGIMCFMLGAAFGAWLTWHTWLRHEKPVLKIVVDRDLLSTVTQEMATDWAERRGLVWMPKGAVFDPRRKVAK